MSDAFWTSFFATLPGTIAAVVAAIGAITALVVSLRNGNKGDAIKKKLDRTAVELRENTEITKTVEKQTNGNTTTLQQSLDAAVQRLAEANDRIHTLSLALAGQERHASLTDAQLAELAEKVAEANSRITRHREASERQLAANQAEIERLRAITSPTVTLTPAVAPPGLTDPGDVLRRPAS